MKAFSLKGGTFFFLGLLVFFILVSEFVVLHLDSLIAGKSLRELNLWKGKWYFLVQHWTVTILIWGTGAFMILFWLKRTGNLQQVFSFAFRKKTLIMITFVIIIALALSILEAKTFSQRLFQITREFTSFQKIHGRNALILSLFQNLYYFFESLLVILIIAFFQMAGELWFNWKKIPWGSIGLFLTWGLGHFISHPQGAFYIAIFSLTPGIVYLISEKNFYPVFLLVFMSFIF